MILPSKFKFLLSNSFDTKGIFKNLPHSTLLSHYDCMQFNRENKNGHLNKFSLDFENEIDTISKLLDANNLKTALIK